MYQSAGTASESYDRKMYRLSQKWLIEAELWLVFMILVELASIYKLAHLNDKRLNIAKNLGMTEDEIKNLENNY
jgi:hypothetical protein